MPCDHGAVPTTVVTVRVQSSYVNTEEFQPREGRRIRREKNSVRTRMASLIGSKLAKIN